MYQRKVLRYKIMMKEIFIVRNGITLRAAILKQPPTTIFRKFLRIIPVVEPFFWSSYRLTVQGKNYILKWLHQEWFF